jgi:hypothetical protein
MSTKIVCSLTETIVQLQGRIIGKIYMDECGVNQAPAARHLSLFLQVQ